MDYSLLIAIVIAVTFTQIVLAFAGVMCGDSEMVRNKKHFLLHFIPFYLAYVAIIKFTKNFRKL